MLPPELFPPTRAPRALPRVFSPRMLLLVFFFFFFCVCKLLGLFSPHVPVGLSPPIPSWLPLVSAGRLHAGVPAWSLPAPARSSPQLPSTPHARGDGEESVCVCVRVCVVGCPCPSSTTLPAASCLPDQTLLKRLHSSG